MTTKKNVTRVLIGISAVLVLAALIMSMISSNTAYALSRINLVYIGCGAALLIDVLVIALERKLPEAVRDLMLLISVFAVSLAMCMVIEGRTTLMGYIYFSDLESNNPVAIRAMHLAIGAICAYLAALVLIIVTGFKKTVRA